MKKHIFNSIIIFIICTILVSFTSNNIIVEKKVINTSKSKIEWFGAKITGKHNGSINLKSGLFLFENNKLIGGEFVVDMNTIVCTDLSDKIELKKRLEADLNSDHFFNVSKYPESKFKITSIGVLAPDKYKITGDLTIKDITLSNSCEIVFEDNKAFGSIIIDRTKYNMTLRSGSVFENLGNKLIYDEFELKFVFVF